MDADPPKPPRPKRIRPRRSRPRHRTVAAKDITKTSLREEWARLAMYDDVDAELQPRPRTRAECPIERPCPWVGCVHHMFLDVNPETGSIIFNFPELEPWEMVTESCELDLAARGGMTLEDVGTQMNITRERVRQLEVRALIKSKAPAREAELYEVEIGGNHRSPLGELEDMLGVSPSDVTYQVG